MPAKVGRIDLVCFLWSRPSETYPPEDEHEVGRFWIYDGLQVWPATVACSFYKFDPVAGQDHRESIQDYEKT